MRLAWRTLGMMLTVKHRDGAIFVAMALWSAALTGVTFGQWTNGLSTNENFFPIGVWLQRPTDAPRWLAAGVNLYTGLWNGPTVEQLETLRGAGIRTITDQNAVGLSYTGALANGQSVIAGWLMPDEPDNAQPNGGGWGPPVPTAIIQQFYQQYQTNDPTRPIFLNLSQGLGWDTATWYGQGGYIVPATHYPQYILGSDIISFDIYPMASPDSGVAGGAWRVAMGVDRLRQYAPTNHPVWAFIETGDIHANDQQATVAQIRAEVWMALIHGASGINYFIHGKTSTNNFDDRALLHPENAARLAGFTTINGEVYSLAAALKSQSVVGLVTMTNVVGTSPVDFMVKQHNGATYLFAVGMRNVTTTKAFGFLNLSNNVFEVIGENRAVSLTNGYFTDTFDGYQAHLYRTGGSDVISLAISVNPPGVTLSWNSLNGLPYTIRYKTNLNQIPWTLLTTIPGVGGATTFTDTNSFEAQRYYQITSP
jgi:hypothetical protein